MFVWRGRDKRKTEANGSVGGCGEGVLLRRVPWFPGGWVGGMLGKG